MNIPLMLGGSLAMIGAAVHGGLGEVLVLRKLSPGTLPSTSFGGSGSTKAMIWVSWHMGTIGLLTVGFALLLSGSVLHGDTARGVGLVAAGASTGFAMVALGQGLYTQPLRSVFLHPGPPALAGIAMLAWWGAL